MPLSKTQRREDAEVRHARWDALSPKEQLRQLDIRLGKGVGAKKQRVRLAKRIAEEEAPISHAVAKAAEKNK